MQDKQQLEESLHKLWDLDTLGIREKDDVQTDLIDNNTFTNSRYSVSLSWEVGHKELPRNYDVCYARLQNLLKKLKRDPAVMAKYDEAIQDQLQTGVIERVSTLESAEKVHYLVHHAVIREEAETTKVGIAFDATCKEHRSSTSLNDCLHFWPSLTLLIFDILLRFRHYRVPLIGDIGKAF